LVGFTGGGSGLVNGDDAVALGDDEEVDEVHLISGRAMVVTVRQIASSSEG
jgi:hypothetical protein